MHLRRSSTWNQFSGFENSILHPLDFHCVYAHVFFEFFLKLLMGMQQIRTGVCTSSEML